MSETTAGPVVLLTGASSGIGEATALRLSGAGCRVFAAARRTDRMSGLAARGIPVVPLDVTDDASASAAVAHVLAETGRIDVLVNNAGYGSYGAVEDVPIDEARAQFEVNLFGAARLTQLVLPGMRERRSGRIINISSMGGRITTPLGAWYHATKFAVEGFSDTLRMELRGFGIDVVVIEPGSIRTEWGAIAARQLEQASGTGAYAGQARAMAATLGAESSASRYSPPSVVADAILRAVRARWPRSRYVVGYGARPLLLLKLALPPRAYDVLAKRAMGVPD
jgi:NAD(P)-dependent dehydrogenase (short-subunit alcohol dehydrogenase family)